MRWIPMSNSILEDIPEVAHFHCQNSAPPAPYLAAFAHPPISCGRPHDAPGGPCLLLFMLMLPHKRCHHHRRRPPTWNRHSPRVELSAASAPSPRPANAATRQNPKEHYMSSHRNGEIGSEYLPTRGVLGGVEGEVEDYYHSIQRQKPERERRPRVVRSMIRRPSTAPPSR